MQKAVLLREGSRKWKTQDDPTFADFIEHCPDRGHEGLSLEAPSHAVFHLGQAHADLRRYTSFDERLISRECSIDTIWIDRNEKICKIVAPDPILKENRDRKSQRLTTIHKWP